MTKRAGRHSRNAGSFLRKELPDRAEDRPLQSKGAAAGGIVCMEESFRPLWGLGLSAKGRYHPSPDGAAFFQRKKAFALRHVPLVTQKAFP